MDGDGVSLREMVAIVSRRRWQLLLPAALVLALAVAVACYLPRKYRSTATILIEAQDVPSEYIKSNITGFADLRLQSINQRIMGTPRLLELISKLNLYQDRVGKETTEEIVARMAEDIDFATISVNAQDPRSGRSGQATIAFSVSYVAASPELAHLVANELSSLYLEENLKVRERQSAGTWKFLQGELEELRASLAEIQRRIAAFKQRNINALPERSQANLQSYDQTDRDIKQLEGNLRSLGEKEAYLKGQLPGVAPQAAGQALQQLRQRLEELRRGFSEQYPEVVKLRGEIEELEQQGRAAKRHGAAGRPDNPAYLALESQLAATRSEMAAARRQLSALVQQRNGYQGRLMASPRVEEEYQGLLAERNSRQQKFDDLFKKAMEAKMADGLEKEQLAERFTLIEPPRLPERPFSPNVRAILLVALALGLACGGAVAALCEYADQSVRSVEELNRILSLPVLVTLPTIVTRADLEAARRRRAIALTAVLLCAAVSVGLIHFLVLDLSFLWAQWPQRLQGQG